MREIKKHFFDIQVCEELVSQKTLEISEDIYNIYRLRNMRVHSGYTDSPLLRHYSSRRLMYGRSVIQPITAVLYQEGKMPSNPLDLYLQKIFIQGNIALEALYNGDMERFRNWVLDGS